jgi:phosphoglycolate phosphatase-like HAD superfamily hydrolase
LFRAQAEHHLDLEDCFFIGDRLSDIQCAINAGCTPILLRHPLASQRHNEDEDVEAGRLASIAVENLREAATWIISLGRADFTDDSIIPPSPSDLLL